MCLVNINTHSSMVVFGCLQCPMFVTCGLDGSDMVLGVWNLSSGEVLTGSLRLALEWSNVTSLLMLTLLSRLVSLRELGMMNFIK